MYWESDAYRHISGNGTELFLNYDFSHFLNKTTFSKNRADIKKYGGKHHRTCDDQLDHWENHHIHIYYSRVCDGITNGSLASFLEKCIDRNLSVNIHVPRLNEYLKRAICEQITRIPGATRIKIITEKMTVTSTFFSFYAKRDILDEENDTYTKNVGVKWYVRVGWRGDCITVNMFCLRGYPNNKISPVDAVYLGEMSPLCVISRNPILV